MRLYLLPYTPDFVSSDKFCYRIRQILLYPARELPSVWDFGVVGGPGWTEIPGHPGPAIATRFGVNNRIGVGRFYNCAGVASLLWCVYTCPRPAPSVRAVPGPLCPVQAVGVDGGAPAGAARRLPAAAYRAKLLMWGPESPRVMLYPGFVIINLFMNIASILPVQRRGNNAQGVLF